MTEYLEVMDRQTSHERGKSSYTNAKELARMAMTVYKYLEYTFDELEHAGFTGLEFIEKTELFLKCVTPSYPELSFNQILSTLEQIDNRFPKTKFYGALVGLRALCNGGNMVIEIVNERGGHDNEFTDRIRKELVFFVSILIEKLTRHLREYRKQKDIAGFTNQSFRVIIEDKFDECVMQTVYLLNTTN